MLSKNGYRTDSAKREVLEKLKEPPKTTGIHSVYHFFIKDFSWKAKVLLDLLCKERTGHTTGQTTQKTDETKGKKYKKIRCVQRPSTDVVYWTQNHLDVLEELLQCLKEPPVMAHSDFTLPIIPHCYISKLGLGAVLYQKHDDAT